MKTKISLLLLILANSLQLIVSQTWEYSNALENEWMRKICTHGLDTVYIVGNNGLIARSTDRSLTWNKQYPVTVQLNDIIFCNYTTGFTVGNNGTILKTTNNGDTWTQVSSGTTENLNAIAALGINNIWIVGDDGKVLYSHDGGSSWQIKDLSLSTKLNDISFINNTGYIVGNSAVCYKTTDSGDNWNNNSLNNNGNNLIVQQRANNDLYILYGTEPSNLYVNGEIKPVVPSYISTAVRFSSFYMMNDSIGYGGLFPLIPTGSGYGSVLMTLFKYGDCISTVHLPLYTACDEYSSDILIVNDSIGYAVTGTALYRMNNSTATGISKLQSNEDFNFKQEKDFLIVSPINPERLTELEISTLSGVVICKQKGTEVYIATIRSGLYLIKVISDNNSFVVKKWIKY